jgi:hypothetical protein
MRPPSTYPSGRCGTGRRCSKFRHCIDIKGHMPWTPPPHRTIALKAQVDLLSAVMRELCRTLRPEQARALTVGVRARLAAGHMESEAADEA